MEQSGGQPSDVTDPEATKLLDEIVAELIRRIREVEEFASTDVVDGWISHLCSGPAASEADVRRALRKHPEVHFSPRSGQYRLKTPEEVVRKSEAEPTPVGPKILDLLSVWVSAPDEGQKSAAAESVGQLMAELQPDDGLVAVARALGIVQGTTVWDEVPVDAAMPSAVIDALVGAAPLGWVFDAAAILPQKSSGPAQRRVQEMVEIDRLELASARLAAWSASVSGSELAGRLRRVGKIVGATPNVALTATVLRLATDAACRSDESGGGSANVVSAWCTLLMSAPEVVLAEVLNRFDDGESVRALLIALATEGGGRDGSKLRVGLIGAVARSTMSVPLFDRAVFKGLGLDEIGSLLKVPAFAALRGRGLEQHLREPVSAACPGKFGAAIGAVAEHPELELLMPSDLLARRVRSDEPSARIARAALRELVDDAVRDEQGKARAMIRELTEQVAAADARVDEQRQAADAERQRAEQAEDRLRALLGQSHSLSEHERRQARLDVLSTMVDQIVRLGDAESSEGAPAWLVQLIESSERELESFGVRSIGTRGESVPYDTALHQPVAAEQGEEVEVVRPAYRLDDSETPLRYGLVRLRK